MNVTILFTVLFMLVTPLCSSEECTPPTAKERAQVKRTSLHEAATTSNLERVKHYVCNGFRINRQDFQGRTPLHVAKGIEVINYLLNKGAKVNARDYQGKNPFYFSIAHQWEATQPQQSLKKRGKYKVSPLSTQELKEKLKLLMEKGARIDMCDYEGMTILHFLAQRKELSDKKEYSDILNFLMERGASPAMKEPDQGNTPLHFAAQNNNFVAAEIFLKNSKKVALAENAKCLTPLDCVDEENTKEWEILFKKYGIENARSTRVYQEEYPLHYAIEQGNYDSFKQIFDAHAENSDSLKKKDAAGKTALHRAIEKGNRKMASLLARKDINLLLMKDIMRRTPCHYMAKHEMSFGKGALNLPFKAAGVNSVVKKGLIARDIFGKTALFYCNSGELTQQFCAEVTIKDHQGKTPLHYAYAKGKRGLINGLMLDGVDPWARDNFGQIPSQIYSKSKARHGR